MKKLFWTQVAVFKSLIIICVLLSLIGCNQEESIPLTDGYQTQELVDIVNEIRSQYPKASPHLVKHIVITDDFEVEGYSDAVGVCRILDDGHNTPLELVIRESSWDRMDRDGKVALVAHELLHCDWSLDHADDGLMHPYHRRSKHEIQKYGLLDALLCALGY